MTDSLALPPRKYGIQRREPRVPVERRLHLSCGANDTLAAIPTRNISQIARCASHSAPPSRMITGTVHSVFRYLPGMWDLFVRLVSGETTMAKQLERRSIRGLVGLLGG